MRFFYRKAHFDTKSIITFFWDTLYLNTMVEIGNFRTVGGIESTTDRFGKMMAELRKLDLAANMNFPQEGPF